MGLSALVLAAGVAWNPWSAETFDRARRAEKPVFLAVVAAARGAGTASLDDDAIAGLLADRFVAVRADAAERPDLVDVARLGVAASSEADPPEPTAALWAVFTPSLHPIAAGALDGVSANDFETRLSAIAEDFRDRRREVETRAGIAAARLAAAQVPEASQGALDASTLGRVLAGIRGAPRPTPGSLRLLFAEWARSPAAATRAEVTEAVMASLATPIGPTTADRALRLRGLALGFVATGLAPLRDGVVTAASQVLEGRDPDGVFVSSPEDRRTFAFENGLAVSALVASSTALGRATDLAAAEKAGAATIARLGPWSSLARCAGPAGRCGPAFLEDYAFLAEAFLDLHEATTEPRWRDEARGATDAAVGRFLDASNRGFFDTDGSHAPLPARLKSGYDGARPGANGVMAAALFRLARVTGEQRYAELARGVIEAFRGDLQRAPHGMETLAAAAVPFVVTARPVSGEPTRPARQTRGPVTVEAALDPQTTPPAATVQALVRLVITAPWTVNGHRPETADRVPLTVSVPGDRFTVGPIVYPHEAALAEKGVVLVPLRLRPDLPAGPNTVRLTVRFQRCRGPECQAPESVILEVPLVVEPRGR